MTHRASLDNLRRIPVRRHALVLITEYAECGIYVLAAVLLMVAGLLVLWRAGSMLATDLHQGKKASDIATGALDNALLLFIVVGLLHVAVTGVQKRILVIEPILIVVLIAAIRGILQITSPVSDVGFNWRGSGIELIVLMALVLGVSVSVVLLGRLVGRRPS
jgi:hypothetical protein